MTTDALLDHRLAVLRRRVRLLLAERSALTAGAYAAAAGLLLVVLDRLHVLRVEWAHLAALLIAGLVIGWLWGFLRRLTDFEVARVAEQRITLKERLSSAVVLAPRSSADPMVSALLEDAAEHLNSVRPSRLFPRRLARNGLAFLGLVIALLAAVILPELPAFQSAATRQERADLRREGERLVKLSERLPKKELPQRAKVLRQVARNMKALGKDMQTGRVDRKQALVQLHKLEKLSKLAQYNPNTPQGEKSLARAAAEIRANQVALAKMRLDQRNQALAQLKAGTVSGKPLTEEQRKALEKLTQSSSKTSPSQKLLNLDTDLASKIAELLARQDVQEALKTLQQLADKLGDPQTLQKMTPEERKRLAEELRKMAEALKNTDLDKLAQQIKDLAEALKSGRLKLCQVRAGKVGGT